MGISSIKRVLCDFFKLACKSDADVVFVGAGPVGLWTAIQTKLRDPKIRVVVLERHSTYKRSQALNIAKECFNGAPDDARIQAIIADFKSRKVVNTSEIETRFKALAEEIGIVIKKQKVTDPAKLTKQFPKAKVFFGADGAHSVVREKIFEERLRVDSDLQYLAEVKYQVVGGVKRLPWFSKGSLAIDLRSIGEEIIGREVNGITPVSIRMLIDKNTFQSMRNARFSSPYTLKQHERLIDQELKRKIFRWFDARESKLRERRVRGSEKITVIRLGTYVSENFIKKQAGITWGLVGDSAFGVPFRRSFANGAMCGTVAAKAISESFSEEKPKQFMPQFIQNYWKTSFDDYSAYADSLARSQERLAYIKSFGMNALRSIVEATKIFPWSFEQWYDTRTLA